MLEQIKNSFEGSKGFIDDETVNYQINVFNNLCEKAKSLLWKEFFEPNSTYLHEAKLENYLIKLTPIEQILHIAFDIFAYTKSDNGQLYFRPIPQQYIRTKKACYVVDFLIENFVVFGTEWHCNKKIVVECDGYDSHHTKEQRNYDVERENDLKMNGYSVIRFTGSQIYKDPYSCVYDVALFLINENCDVIKEAQKQSQKDKNIAIKKEK